MINKVTLIGNLGGDPEVRHLESGVQVARFSVATNESYKDKDGNFQQITEWHNVVCWRELAERAEKMLKKGMLVYVEGKISYRKYTTQEGQDRYVTDIVANTFRLLERREGGGFDSRFPTSEETPAGKTSASEIPVSEPANNGDDSAGDDLPF
ncbi:MAG: single-stranded DNA-binding protein [Lewinellaceae bacterium]|nr:single-stranded DNA-binding protein [Saprospiraceae bacterium]MCB9317178.1 single-stranded DNA-binding protein [Lewinellaceae bacterium]MCB9331255.1 single-stranded DNA-binding protein [Lewinellaceae bacterium]